MYFTFYHFKGIKGHGGIEPPYSTGYRTSAFTKDLDSHLEKSTLHGFALLQNSQQALLHSLLAPCEESKHLTRRSWEIFQHHPPQRKGFSGSQDDFQQWKQVSPLNKRICQTKTETCSFQGTRVHLRASAVSSTIKR